MRLVPPQADLAEGYDLLVLRQLTGLFPQHPQRNQFGTLDPYLRMFCRGTDVQQDEISAFIQLALHLLR